MEDQDMVPAVVTHKNFAQLYRTHLEKNGFLDTRFRLRNLTDNKVALPVLISRLAELNLQHLQDIAAPEGTCSITHMKSQTLVSSKKSCVKSLQRRLQEHVRSLVESTEVMWSEELVRDLPQTWKQHGDLILIAESTFQDPIWKKFGSDIWKTVATALGVKRVAKISRISRDGFRTPVVTLLLGEDSWVNHVDNGIRYEFDVTKCMFSSGNITEKLRIMTFDCTGETVVDLYAGIGYFTLPYLIHSKASLVHACEWNPDAVSALRRNLHLNRVSHKCVIHEGDNRQLSMCDVADRVNLGLIPSSEEGWPTACRLLRQNSGGILHIHQNVTSVPHKPALFQQDTCSQEASEEYHKCKNKVIPSENNDTMFEENFCSSSAKGRIKSEWGKWAETAASQITKLLMENWGKPWKTHIRHIQHVKSYAPHIDHIVLDLQCRPSC
ncbi:tRNA wybutosine-synthesizing protein 2 homolog [Erpetoichthys calabaricus]|uniref:tRNA wybutosine-synthesizing protein 2 homolog n=1 Tax=Erpetoichthys calabaricus TaxID=27687 RepID=A0A8C4SLH4_ERPCA|nr:tRNA wybutosine-synthesizing protein 2 homolog [Erpetoichthys calabaricus]